MEKTLDTDLFASLVSEIKNYTGTDPLLPWLRGIRRLRGSLSPLMLKEKLPRFLQKCAQNFQTDQRYRNDLRYLRVWIQLMDFVDDPRSLLKTMEMNRIGTKHALFYQAYALYFEKLRKFEESERMYHLGVQNLAEPMGELQKAYEQFLRRMEQYQKRKARRQEARAAMASRSTRSRDGDIEESRGIHCEFKGPTRTGHGASEHCHKIDNRKVREESEGVKGPLGSRYSSKQQESNNMASDRSNIMCTDETVVVKFVDTAIVGKSEAENACHHGLVDPTINLKDAMNDINNMFREPIELETVHRRKSQRSLPKPEQKTSSGFEVFVDENLDDSAGNNKENNYVPKNSGILAKKQGTDRRLPMQETFEIFVDGEDEGDCSEGDDGGNSSDKTGHLTEGSGSDQRVNAFVFPRPNNIPTHGSINTDGKRSPTMKMREDTVVGRFVGSAILDEPDEIENACHHGLVDPTINLKEAMDAINSMFGKPIDFVRATRNRKQGKFEDKKRECGGFSILQDDNLKPQPPPRKSPCTSSKMNAENDLFEPTLFTKQAMDDINEMFGQPLDF